MSQLFVSSSLSCLLALHSRGPYDNLKDLAVFCYIGLPLFQCYRNLCVNHQVNEQSCLSSPLESKHVSICAQFDSNIGFITKPSTPLVCDMNSPMNMNESKAYLAAVSDILSAGIPYYCGKRIPLLSVFNWKFIDKHIGSYHDGPLVDYY